MVYMEAIIVLTTVYSPAVLCSAPISTEKLNNLFIYSNVMGFIKFVNFIRKFIKISRIQNL